MSCLLTFAGLELALGLGPWYGHVVPLLDEHAGAEGTSDTELVMAMARGDAAALAKLYDLHASLLLGIVRRIVRNNEAAEDIVHDVFIEAWRRAADYDPGRGSVKTWLTLRARSRALDHKKSSAVARRVTLDEPHSQNPLTAVDESASLAPDQDRVRRALVSLPEEQYRVLLLGYFEGLSSSEIAERVGIPVGTVKSRVAAALARLRAALGAEQEGKP